MRGAEVIYMKIHRLQLGYIRRTTQGCIRLHRFTWGYTLFEVTQSYIRLQVTWVIPVQPGVAICNYLFAAYLCSHMLACNSVQQSQCNNVWLYCVDIIMQPYVTLCSFMHCVAICNLCNPITQRIAYACVFMCITSAPCMQLYALQPSVTQCTQPSVTKVAWCSLSQFHVTLRSLM